MSVQDGSAVVQRRADHFDQLKVESLDREAEDQAYLLERPKGRFQRQVHLGDGLDAASITADYNDGVLTLRIPAAERAQPRKINVGTDHTAIEAESAESERRIVDAFSAAVDSSDPALLQR